MIKKEREGRGDLLQYQMRNSRVSSSAIWSPPQMRRGSGCELEEEWPSFSPFQVRRRMETPSPVREPERLMSSPPKHFRLKLKGILPASLRSSLSINPAQSFAESQIENQDYAFQISPNPRNQRIDLKRNSFLLLRPTQIAPSSFTPPKPQSDQAKDTLTPNYGQKEGQGGISNEEGKIIKISPSILSNSSSRITRESVKKAEVRIHKQIQKRKYVRKMPFVGRKQAVLRKLKQKKTPTTREVKLRPKQKEQKERKGKSIKTQETKEESLMNEKDSSRVQFKITADPAIKPPSPTKLPPTTPQPPVKSKYQCPVCFRCFASGQGLGGHRSKHDSKCHGKAGKGEKII